MISKCPACENISIEVALKNYYNHDLMQCNNCNVVFCVPFKAPTADFYIQGDDEESTRRHTKVSTWHKTHPSRFSENLNNGINKTILDIGCGNGDFAEFASSRGFDVTGIDIDTASLKVANSRKIEKARFINTTLLQLAQADNGIKFDIISMFEVFEHLDNPKETIELIKTLLKPGGLFIGTLPNENRYFAKKLNLKFALPPYHLTYWTVDSWSKFLEMNLFKRFFCENNAYYGYLCNIMFEKTLQSLKIKRNRKNILSFGFEVLFNILKKLEILVEKTSKNASSFYFEFKIDS